MNSRKFGKSLLASAVGLAVLAGVAAPAQASDTTATFSVTAAGGLSISAPASRSLGSAASGAAAVSPVQLGTVTATDSRGANLASWTATVSSTDFTTGQASSSETVGKANVTYWSGLATASSGTAVFLPGQAADLNKATLGAAATAFSASGIVGNNSASWNPTIGVALPSSAVVGTYTGTITHSIA